MSLRYPPVTLFPGALLLATVAATGCGAASRSASLDFDVLPDQWRTHAERTAYAETGRYAEAVDFCRRLAAASPFAHYTTFGLTGMGRPLPLLILSSDRAFTPAAARRAGRPVVLIQCCIHAGECEGKDACLQLAREMVITGTRAALLDHVTLLIMPIFNADGHERTSRYSRINQNGPRELGWRTNAANLNINRDYTKADTPEMQAWLSVWTAWQPDLFIDTHTTDGHDHRYDVFYSATIDPDSSPPIVTWTRDTLLANVLPALEADGYAAMPYSFPRDAKDPAGGIATPGPMGPRFSTGYGAACNRPALLVETHALLPYARRVQTTHALLVHALTTVNRDPNRLRAAIQDADHLMIRTRGADPDGRVPLRFAATGNSQPLVYRGVVQTLRASDITGDDIIEYTKTPLDVSTRLYDDWRVAAAVVPPLAYLVPPQWTTVIERLALHGIEMLRIPAPRTVEVEIYRFTDVQFNPTPYEGRQLARYTTTVTHETRRFSAGTILVPLDQPQARLVVHLLEPDSPDSFVAWGFFNAIFERKEYAEAYAMEPHAQRMLAEDAALRQEFARRLADDPAFAASPGQRLDFFYRRSPYWDVEHNLYPVARVTDASAARELRVAATARVTRSDD